MGLAASVHTQDPVNAELNGIHHGLSFWACNCKDITDTRESPGNIGYY